MSWFKRNKYGNKITEVDGRKFHSKAEAERYLVNRDREAKGEISDLKCQDVFSIGWLGKDICKYIADFTYLENGKLVVEDVKGHRTGEYRLKKRLMFVLFGIEIREIDVKSRRKRK